MCLKHDIYSSLSPQVCQLQLHEDDTLIPQKQMVCISKIYSSLFD